jgi:glycine hydroxymethyltransferase
MGLELSHGGHLTHGSKGSITSKVFNASSYTVNPETGWLDYDLVEDLAKKSKPQLIISGTTAYSRAIDFEIFGEIARKVGAFHISDIAHISGLVVAGLHKSPVPYADIVSTTTHKTLRGPRGGMLLSKKDFARNIDKAVIPGQQGGPHMHTIAAIAVALAEADTEEFILYAKQIIKNAAHLAEKLIEYGFDLVTGGTDNHLILIDLRKKGIPGKKLAKALDRARIVTNFNTVPGDIAPPTNPNGLRIGTPAITTRGMREEHMGYIAQLIREVTENIDNESVIEQVGKKVLLLSSQFPVPEHFIIPTKKKPIFNILDNLPE